MPLAACARHSFATPRFTFRNSRSRDLLRVCGNLQPGAAGSGERARRPQGGAHCTVEGRRSGDGKPGLFDTTSGGAGTPRLEDSRGAHDSTLGCFDSRRVRRISRTLDHSRQLLFEGDARFLGDVAQLFDDGQNQGQAILAAPFFRFAFRVTGQEGPVGTGRGLGGAEDANVVVNLALERIPVDEAVDLHSAKEMADPVADAALWNFLAKSKWRRERPPIRAAKNAAQDIHHNGEAVAFMSAAVAIGTERQERSSRDHVVRIGCVAALAVDGPALGNRLAAPAGYFDFSVGGGTGSHIEHDGRLLLTGETNSYGVGAEHALGAPQGGDQLG